MISQKGLPMFAPLWNEMPIGSYRLSINFRLLDLARFKFATAAILIFKFSSTRNQRSNPPIVKTTHTLCAANVKPCNNGWIVGGIHEVKNCSSKFHDIVKQCLEQMHCFYVFGIVQQSFSQHANEKCQRASGTLHAWNRQAGFGKHVFVCMERNQKQLLYLVYFLAKKRCQPHYFPLARWNYDSAFCLFFLLLIRVFWSPDHRCTCVRRKVYSNKFSEFQRARFIPSEDGIPNRNAIFLLNEYNAYDLP